MYDVHLYSHCIEDMYHHNSILWALNVYERVDCVILARWTSATTIYFYAGRFICSDLLYMHTVFIVELN